MKIVWTHLNEDQASGRACVVCERLVSAESRAVPIGRSVTGSEVFACPFNVCLPRYNRRSWDVPREELRIQYG